MIVQGGIGASGRGDRAGGWMLLHAPAAAVMDLPPMAEWLDTLGLAPDDAGHLHFGGHAFDWVEGAPAKLLFDGMHLAPVRLVGLPVAPDTGGGLTFGVRCTRDDAVDIESVQRLSALVALVASTLPGAAIGWLPARIWSSAPLFADAVIASERQGLPPAMHLVRFDTAEGAETSVTTDGLVWFCGHELRLTAPSRYPAREAIRRAARLAVDALVHRGLAGPMTVDGIDKGEILIIGAQADGMVPVELRPPPG